MKKTTANLLGLCALTVAASLQAVACGGGQKPPASSASAESADQAPSAAANSPAPAALGSASPAPAAADSSAPPSPLAQVLTTDSGAIQKIFEAASSAPPATMKAGGADGSDELAKGVREASKKLPGGMKPEGPMATGLVREKQHLQTDVTLQPGKCYSIIGFSRKVKDLDLYLLLPPGILSAQDLTDDNKPVIGGPPQPMCPVATTPITYKLDIFADKGSGDVAVQVFSKSP